MVAAATGPTRTGVQAPEAWTLSAGGPKVPRKTAAARTAAVMPARLTATSNSALNLGCRRTAGEAIVPTTTAGTSQLLVVTSRQQPSRTSVSVTRHAARPSGNGTTAGAASAK